MGWWDGGAVRDGEAWGMGPPQHSQARRRRGIDRHGSSRPRLVRVGFGVRFRVTVGVRVEVRVGVRGKGWG